MSDILRLALKLDRDLDVRYALQRVDGNRWKRNGGKYRAGARVINEKVWAYATLVDGIALQVTLSR